MKILQVIHGYVPDYNAGSENYTSTIVNELLSRGHRITVFSRIEDPFLEEYNLAVKTYDANFKHYTINLARTKDRFISEEVDNAFKEILREVEPDIVHFQHLNHLSLKLPKLVREHGIPSIYTLHDFWLMCPRGQFLQMNLRGEPWNLCDGQENSKCATVCYSRYHTGEYTGSFDEDYWKYWVDKRMAAAREAIKNIDLFISPSKTVTDSFLSSFGEENKVIYLDYGFDLKRLKGRARTREPGVFVFGYIGTHIPAKGIKSLIEAFSKLKNNTILRIWGREKGEFTPYLKKFAISLGEQVYTRIQWMGEFNSDRIVEEVFNKVDCIVVPSIWLENSPLVIHEAQQARVPIITANTGGMAEYVHEGVNGVLFNFRNTNSLANKMDYAITNPDAVIKLGNRGYAFSLTGDVPSVKEHVNKIMDIYSELISQYKTKKK
jgi:glycosyltransferase involved in cell wall biosynthesis